jgi:hypothetical protein
MWFLFFRNCNKSFNIKAFSATSEMCSLVSMGLDHFIKLFPSFFILDPSFHILGTSVRSKSFIEMFVAKVFHEDFGTISNLPMLVDL